MHFKNARDRFKNSPPYDTLKSFVGEGPLLLGRLHRKNTLADQTRDDNYSYSYFH